MATPFPFASGQTLLAAQLNAITTLPTSTKTASHTLVIGDQGTRVIMNSGTATTITVNTAIFGASDVVEIQNIGTAVCTVTAGSCTVSSAGSLAIPQHGGGQLIFSSTSAATFFPTGTKSGVVQVKSTTKTDTFTMSSATFADVTGLSVDITPTSASNKILVLVSMAVASSTTASMYTRLMRGATAIGVGDAAGNRTPASTNIYTSGTSFQNSQSILFLDSPATTSATTYKIQIAGDSGTSTMSVNRTAADTDSSAHSRTISTITVMEVTP